jgi:hypothetical protein
MIGTFYLYLRHKNNMHLEARKYAKELIKMKEEREIRIKERTNEEICWNNNNDLNIDEYNMDSREVIKNHITHK